MQGKILEVKTWCHHGVFNVCVCASVCKRVQKREGVEEVEEAGDVEIEREGGWPTDNVSKNTSDSQDEHHVGVFIGFVTASYFIKTMAGTFRHCHKKTRVFESTASEFKSCVLSLHAFKLKIFVVR